MKQFDHIRTEHLDINEAVGTALTIFNNKRRKNNTVSFEDMQVVNSGLFFCILVYSYEDERAEAPIARKRFISQDHSDE